MIVEFPRDTVMGQNRVYVHRTTKLVRVETARQPHLISYPLKKE